MGAAAPVTLHVVGPEDWRSHRDLRLEMLLDAPDAFSTQHADVVGLDEAGWRSRIAGVRHVQARVDGMPVGSAGLFEDPEDACGTATLVAMYVTPAARGRGVGRRLVQAVLDEAAGRGCDRVLLEVTSGNDAAATLYERMGFVATGRRRPHPRRPGLDEVEMARSLAPQGAPTGPSTHTETRVPRGAPDVEG